MTAIIIMIAVLVVLNVVVITIYIRLGKQLPHDAEYYDENGNHIYYDRKIIRALNKQKEKVPSEQ